MLLRCLIIAGLCFAAPQAWAQYVDPQKLDELTKQQEDAKAQQDTLARERQKTQKDIDGLKQKLVKAAAEAESYEKAGRAIQQRLTTLNSEHQALNGTLYKDRQALAKILSALQRIEANPPPALVISPHDTTKAIQAGYLMKGLKTSLSTRAEEIEKRVVAISDTQIEIEKEKAKLSKNEKALSKRQARIKTLVEDKAKLEAKLSKNHSLAQARVAALAAEADDLRDLIRKFEQSTRAVQPRIKPKLTIDRKPEEIVPRLKPKETEPPEPLLLPPDTLRFTDARDSLRAPVSGKVTKKYTAANKGLTVQTRSKAQVVAPYAGRVEFAGPFKNYDNVVILNVGDGYFILLTGLGEVFASSGEMVNSGEPLGLMPFNSQNRANLYIEFRKNGATVNPTPWLGTAFARQG